MNILWSRWLSNYAFKLFNILPLFVPSCSRRHKGETEKESDTKVWKPCSICNVKFNWLSKGMVTLISGPVLSRGEMMRAMQCLFMVWCYWHFQSYCPGVGFAGGTFKTPLARTVYLKIMVVLEVKALSSALKVFAFNFRMPIGCFAQKKILQIVN